MKSWSFTLQEARKIMAKPPPGQMKQSRDNRATESWDENIGYDGAKEACRTGVKRQRLTSLQNRLRRHLSLQQQKVETERLSRKGRTLDRQRYRQGKPRCTWEKTQEMGFAPAAHIEVDMASLAHVSSDVWLQRGAAVLALLREARRQGISTKLDVVAFSSGCFDQYKEDSLVRVRLKEAGESIAQSIINFGCAHAGFFRRVVFRLREEIAHREGWEVAWGYGSSIYEYEPDTDADLHIPKWEETRSDEDLIDEAVNWTQTIKPETRYE
jgi:hypothetical protein